LGRTLRGAKNIEPLAEVTNQQQNKPSAPRLGKLKKGAIAKKAATPKAIRPAEVGTSQENENETEDRVMTRRQQRESEIHKRDQMAQEAMEMEEA
jgi:hypothetical protein